MTRAAKFPFAVLLFLFSAAAVFTQDEPSREAASGLESYEARLEQFSILLDETHTPTAEELAALRVLSGELRETPYIELSNRARILLTIAEEKSGEEGTESRETALFRLEGYPRPGGFAGLRTNALGLGITLGTSFASLGLFNAFSFMSNIAYGRYISAVNAENAAVLQRAWMLYDILKYVFLGTGAASFGASMPFFFSFGEGEIDADNNPEELRKLRVRLKKRLIRGENNREGWRSAAEAGLGAGVSALIGSALSFGLAESLYYRYNEAMYSADAETARNKVRLFENIGIFAGAGAAAGLLTAAFCTALPADTGFLEYKIDEIDVLLALDKPEQLQDDSREEYVRRRITQLSKLRSEYQKELKQLQKSETAFKALIFSALGTGVASLVGTGVSVGLGIHYYNEYKNLEYTPDAAVYEKKMAIADTASYITGITAAVGLGTSVISALLKPDEERLQEKITAIDARIEEYRRQLVEPGILF